MATAMMKRKPDPMETLYAEWRRHPVTPYRERHYSPKVRCGWWFELVRGAIHGGGHPDNWRTLGVRILSSAGRDWQGSCYTNTLAHFCHVAGGGWTWNGTTYSTLLRAVRAFLAAR